MDGTERRRRARTEAAYWFVRAQAGDMEHSERVQLVDWLRESHVHIAEMLYIAQVHNALEQVERWDGISIGPKTNDNTVVRLPSLSASDQNAIPTSTRNSSAPRPRGKGMRLLAVTAALAIVVLTAVLVLPKIRGQVIETERGERREVVLNDGSMVQVDPETRLRVKYADAVRQVFLEHGRALFHVAKNANRPFMVEADDTTVRAVGTVFGVERQPQGIVVTVAEGKVAVVSSVELPVLDQSESITPRKHAAPVTHRGPGSPKPSAAAGSGDTGGRISQGSSQREERSSSVARTASFRQGEGAVYVSANQQVTVRRSASAEPVREVDSDRELAWAAGRLIFHNDTVAKVIEQFNRYNRTQLSVSDPGLAVRPVSGVFNAPDPEAFIAFLQTVTPIKITRDGDKSITIDSLQRR